MCFYFIFIVNDDIVLLVSISKQHKNSCDIFRCQKNSKKIIVIYSDAKNIAKKIVVIYSDVKKIAKKVVVIYSDVKKNSKKIVVIYFRCQRNSKK